jgi:lysophospholipase L1-like esterase
MQGTPPDPGEAPASRFPQADTIRWLSSILVEGPAQRGVVALGDSITEGSIGDGYRRWTDRIATSGVVIANAGVGGNAISGPGYVNTLDGASRLQALLREPNVTDVVIMLGVNDLTMGKTASQIITAIGKAVALARSAHVAVWVATIMPYRGQFQWTPLQETYRTQVNNFLRATRPSPGVAVTDLDRALRDPGHLDRLLPAYDSGDHQHPSKIAGRTAIAQRVRADLHLP